MPLLMSCDELRPGMKLYEPLVSGGRVMLQGGKPLTEADISVLSRRYPGLCIRVGNQVLDEVVDFEDDSEERGVADRVQHKIVESMTTVGERFSKRSSLDSADFQVIQSSVDELVDYLKTNPTSAALVASCLDGEAYLGVHVGNVFYLSMLLGSSVLDYVASERKRLTKARDLAEHFAMDLTTLGLGVMAMDLGLLPLRDALCTDRPLTEAERILAFDHASTGADMLPQNFPGVAKMIVRTHHENMGGDGFPLGLPPEKQHVFTRIARIADAYDAATSQRVFKRAKLPAQILWDMTRGPYSGFYDPVLTDAFSRLIQPFPVGSKLKLSDGRYAAVSRYNRTDPFRPTVVVAFDERDKPIPREQLEEPIDLSMRRDLVIDSIRGESLGFIYEDDDEEPERAKLKSEFGSMLDVFYP